MNLAILGEQIDIHGGGNDLVFSHTRERESPRANPSTASSSPVTGLHNGMLQTARREDVQVARQLGDNRRFPEPA